MSLSKNQESFAEHSKTEFKGVRAHLEDIESWKKDISSQVANLSRNTQRESFDAVTLRSGKVLAENEKKQEEAAAQEDTAPEGENEKTGRVEPCPVRDTFSPVRDTTNPGR